MAGTEGGEQAVTPAELPAYLRAMGDRARVEAPVAAANAMAQTYQSAVVRSMTGPSPSAPGTPPGRRSGTLARSVRAEPAVSSGDGQATSSVAPHTVYARIQQLGGDIRVVRAKVLTDGKRYFGKEVHLPARPYMVMDDARRTQCHDAAVRAVRRVIGGG
jgi:phage gpG-like protein